MICERKRSARGALDSLRLGGALGAWGMAAALLAAGCGGSGTDDPDPPITGDGNAPTVHVAFPPPLSLTDAATVTLRGTAEDVDGVAAIRVNGADARFTGGGWEATVTLQHGANEVVIESEDDFGAKNAAAAQVTVILSANWMVTPQAVVADVSKDRALVMDSALDVLLAVDNATGERTVLSSDDVGSGTEFSKGIALALDADGQRVLVLDEGLPGVLAVDLATGDRTVVADAATGQGTALVTPVSMVLDAVTDPENPRALVLDVDATTVPGERSVTLYAVDLATGDRTVISDNSADGTNLSNPGTMVLDTTGEGAPTRVLVLDSTLDGVLAVDLTTGTRSSVSVDGAADGPQLSVPTSLALEVSDSGARALVLDSGLDALLAVDLATGARSVVTEVAVGEGPVLGDPSAVLLDPQSGKEGRAVVVDTEQAACIVVDIATSERTEVSSDAVGSGPEFDTPRAVSLDVPVGPQGQVTAVDRVIVADSAEGEDVLLSVNLGTGERTMLTDSSTSSGPRFQNVEAVAMQPAIEAANLPYRALVVDSGLNALIAVDLATGNRLRVSDPTLGTGPELDVPKAVAAELDVSTGLPTGRALVLDAGLGAVLAVDLTTGDRSVIADASTGTGPNLDEPVAMLLETKRATVQDQESGESVAIYVATGRALVLDEGLGALLAVDLGSGTRNELSGPDFGNGPELSRPVSIALDAANERVVMVDEGLDSLLMIDLRTGERVVISR